MTKRKTEKALVAEVVEDVEAVDERGRLRRDTNGLMLIQRQFLHELAVQGGSWRKACRTLNIKERRVRNWLTEDMAFKDAYDALYGPEDLDATRRQLQQLAGSMVDVYEEALEAERGMRMQVKCPKCEHTFMAEGKGADQRVRLRAADTVAKIMKLLTDTKEIKGSVVHTHLTGPEALAILADGFGQPIPEAVRARLAERGLLHE